MKIAFLVSGSLGEVVLKHFLNEVEVSFVLTDKASVEIIELCKNNHIPFFAGNPRTNDIDFFLKEVECEVMASINYLFIIEKNVIDKASGLCFNIHGSLLPKYRGRTPHVWAIINNEKYTGISAHIIDEGCDTGSLIKQIKVEITGDDTGASILAKFKRLYIPLVEEVISQYKHGTLTLKKQDESKATYFGKRTPDDGRINWEWTTERVINWVRAQAYPYPGAFSYFNNHKITIDKVSLSDYGFHYQTPNGTILSLSPLLVKCCNGVLQIDDLREMFCEFEINKMFY